MTAHLTTHDLNRLHRHGAIPLTPATGMTLLDTARSMHDPHLLPTHTNTAKLRALATNQQLNPLWHNLVHGAAHRPTAGTDTDTTPIAQRLAGLTEQEQHHLLVTIARTHTGIVLAHETPEAIDPDTGFLDLGLDSLTALELRNRLTTATGVHLPATLVFDHPTPAALARYLRGRIAPDAVAEPAGGGPEPGADGADEAAGAEADTAIDAMSVDDLIRLVHSEDRH
jgi:acyl carrier protein